MLPRLRQAHRKARAAVRGLSPKSARRGMLSKLQDDEWLAKAGSSWLYPAWMQRRRLQLYLLLEVPESSSAAKSVTLAVFLGIVIAVVALVLETEPAWRGWWVWHGLELGCTVFFGCEYGTRLLVCDTLGDDTMAKFVSRPANVCDFLAILPFMLESMLGPNGKVLRVLRAFRLMRLMRIFRLGRYFAGMRVMADALVSSSQALYVLAFLCAVGMLLFSSIMYYFERLSCPQMLTMAEEQILAYESYCSTSQDGFHPDPDGNGPALCCDRRESGAMFPSITATFWWSIVTMTTVGFGDTYPRTDQGRLVAWFTMLSGILVIALPVAIVGSRFQEVYEEFETGQINEELRLCREQPARREAQREALLLDKVKDTRRLGSLARRVKQRAAQLKTEQPSDVTPALLAKLDSAAALEPRLAERCTKLKALIDKSIAAQAKVRALEEEEKALLARAERDFDAVAACLEDNDHSFISRAKTAPPPEVEGEGEAGEA